MLLGGIAADAKAQDLRSSAAIAVEYEKVYEGEAKARKLASLKQNTGGTVKEIFPEREGQASDEAGELFNVSGMSVRDAKYVAQHDPEAFEKIKTGDLAPSPCFF